MKVVKTYTDDFVINTLPNDWNGNSIHRNGFHEPHINAFLKRNLTKDSVLIDAGSNYGWHSIKSSYLCNTVYSFEPQTRIHDIQAISITENNIKNIVLHNYGLGDKNETKEMAPIDYDKLSLNIGDLNIGVGGQVVEVRTIDSFKFPRVDFMKIDVQGYEKYVLHGAINTIAEHKPTIVIEIEEHQLGKFRYNATALFAVIRDLGYHIYLLDHGYPADHVCVHKDNLEAFIKDNNAFIKILTESNNLNHSMENGVTEKIIHD